MIRIALYLHASIAGRESGHVELTTLLVENDEDYRSEPPRLLTLAEVQEVCRQLRRLPQVNSGIIGEYQWREVSSDQR